MTVATVAVPMARNLAPALAPVLKEAVTTTINGRNARAAARSAHTLAALGMVGQVCIELIHAVPEVMTEVAGMREQRYRHLETMELHGRASDAIQLTATILDAEIALLSDDEDPAHVSEVLASYRRDLLQLAGVTPTAAQ